jgi:hypothetical protein
MTVQEQVDRAYRVAYRLAYPVMRRWWRLLKRKRRAFTTAVVD